MRFGQKQSRILVVQGQKVTKEKTATFNWAAAKASGVWVSPGSSDVSRETGFDR